MVHLSSGISNDLDVFGEEFVAELQRSAWSAAVASAGGHEDNVPDRRGQGKSSSLPNHLKRPGRQ